MNKQMLLSYKNPFILTTVKIEIENKNIKNKKKTQQLIRRNLSLILVYVVEITYKLAKIKIKLWTQ